MKRHALKPLTALLLFTALWTAAAATARETEHRTLDPATSLLLLEIGVIAGVGEDGEVVIETLLPPRARPEENRGVDVRKGDRLLMMNGQRARSLAGVREIYDGLADGGEVKLALGRGEERLLVSFAKKDSDTFEGGGPGSRVRIVRAGAGGDVELLHEARAIVRSNDGKVEIDAVLGDGGELHEGDVIGAVNGREVTDLAGYREAYAAVAIGGALRLTVRRGDEAVDVELTKEERPEGMMIRRGSQ